MLSLAAYIDHTLLKPDANEAAIRTLCEEAIIYQFSSVCVNAIHVPLAASLLQSTEIAVCCVVGFPLGSSSTFAKVCEAREAVISGATELDMVIALGALKSGNWRQVEDDIAAVVKAVAPYAVKVIIETCLLTEQEKELACYVAQKAGAAFVKTSTGFSTGGATVADIELMRATVPNMRIKASGGIRDLATARAMIQAGADRLGCSAGASIVEEERAELGLSPLIEPMPIIDPPVLTESDPASDDSPTDTTDAADTLHATDGTLLGANSLPGFVKTPSSSTAQTPSAIEKRRRRRRRLHTKGTLSAEEEAELRELKMGDPFVSTALETVVLPEIVISVADLPIVDDPLEIIPQRPLSEEEKEALRAIAALHQDKANETASETPPEPVDTYDVATIASHPAEHDDEATKPRGLEGSQSYCNAE